ncbi:hypothetical protein TRIP_C21055 [Candidatus Zixiibacteriota bacterium]|nr:hypothetical protein TRIP_C21055 [candidate division Zixibacteria bacterium]
MKILLVANDSGACETFKGQLESAKHEIVKTPICTQGFKRLESDTAIDLIIIDVDSAEECGLNLLRAIRQDQRFIFFPVLMAGKSFSEQNVVSYHKWGVNDILVYPVSQVTLEAKLTRIEREGKKTVLIVDDEPMIAEILSDMLTAQRFRTVTAASGEEALEILRNRVIHALVTDIMMPKISGIDLLRVVKSNYTHIPVVMITGQYGRYKPQDAITLGADGFFAKPFHNTELIFTLRSLLAQYHSLQSQPARPATQ